MALEKIIQVAAGEQTGSRETAFHQDGPCPVAQGAAEQLHHRGAEALLWPVNDLVGEQALDGFFEEVFHKAVACFETRGNIVREVRVSGIGVGAP